MAKTHVYEVRVEQVGTLGFFTNQTKAKTKVLDYFNELNEDFTFSASATRWVYSNDGVTVVIKQHQVV